MADNELKRSPAGGGATGCEGNMSGAVSELHRQHGNAGAGGPPGYGGGSAGPNTAGTSPPNAGWGQVDHSKEPKGSFGKLGK